VNDPTKSLGDLRRFSVAWSFAAALLHIVGTIVFVGMTFLTGMGSFTHDVSFDVALLRGVLWVWTPLAMGAWNPQDMSHDDKLFGLALLWSCCVGIAAGFIIPLIRRWLYGPLYP